jgi:hypothetical protein
MNKVFSIKSGKTVGSGKVVLLIFLTVLISRQKAISVFSLNGLGVRVFNLLILECPLTLERSGISRKPSFPLFPEEVGQKRAFPLSFREGRTNPYLMQVSREPFPLFFIWVGFGGLRVGDCGHFRHRNSFRKKTGYIKGCHWGKPF